MLSVEAAPETQDNARAPMTDASEGERIALRRSRLGWSQTDLATRAGVSLGTVLRIEKDRNVRRDNWTSVIGALDAGEAARALPALELDMTLGGRIGSGFASLQPSLETTRPRDLSRHGGEYQSDFPRGADAPESAAETRIRELEQQLAAEQAAHAEMRALATRLTDILATRLEAIAARLPETRGRKRR